MLTRLATTQHVGSGDGKREERCAGRRRHPSRRSSWLLVLGVVLVSLVGCVDHEAVLGNGDAQQRPSQSPSAPPVGDSAGENACGGDGELELAGAPVEPGDPCGECGDGSVICEEENEVRCVAAAQKNECGGCQLLHAEVGDACGPCGEGTWECDDEGGLECVGGGEQNACNGCGELEAEPGQPCGTDGEGGYACTGPENVRCVTAAGENPCGGTELLDRQPGDPCGPCGGGGVACVGENETTCVEEDRGVNDCGGCAQLPGVVGHRCGGCDGTFQCDGENDLTCVGGRPNRCGGCEPLERQPGDDCRFGDGMFVCIGPEMVDCLETAQNSCGGNTILEGLPGQTCGECDDGEYLCAAPDKVVCSGASEVNGCGGCEPLVGEPLETCGACGDGLYNCASPDALMCVGNTENACGGCGDLAEEPGELCGDGGSWVCAGPENVKCDDDVEVTDNWGDEFLSSESLNDIWGASTDAIWAAGHAGEVLRYDGAGWGEADVDTNAYMGGVDGVGADDVWVLGGREPGDDDLGVVFLHYDGESWEKVEVSLDSAGEFNFYDVAVVASDDVWAVGASETVVRYDGEEWSEVENVPTDGRLLNGVASLAGDVWIVGNEGLILRFDGDGWEEPSGIDIEEAIRDISVVDGENAFWLAAGPKMIRYHNGDWEEFPIVGGETITGIWARSLDDAWGTGGAGGRALVARTVYENGDWNRNAAEVQYTESMPMTAVFGIDGEIRIAGGGGGGGGRLMVFEGDPDDPDEL